MIAITVTGSNYDSVPPSLRTADFSPEMQMTVSNLTGSPLSLELDPGYMLEASEHGYQAMLLTQAVALYLKPREIQRNFLYAMCTQLHNSGPNPSLHYHVAELAKPDLLKMAQFIASKRYQSFAAQEAVWSLSDDRPIPAIGGTSAMDHDLQLEAANIKGLDLEKLKKEYNNSTANDRIIYLNGDRLNRNIPFEIKDSAMVSVGFYGADGELLKPIASDVLLRGGKHSFRYDPFPVAFAGKRYTVRMIKDGAVYREYYFRQ
jgi:hypothetical protein